MIVRTTAYAGSSVTAGSAMSFSSGTVTGWEERRSAAVSWSATTQPSARSTTAVTTTPMTRRVPLVSTRDYDPPIRTYRTP